MPIEILFVVMFVLIILSGATVAIRIFDKEDMGYRQFLFMTLILGLWINSSYKTVSDDCVATTMTCNTVNHIQLLVIQQNDKYCKIINLNERFDRIFDDDQKFLVKQFGVRYSKLIRWQSYIKVYIE